MTEQGATAALPQLHELPDDADEAPAAGVSYSYKASLIGSPQRFELTDAGLSWHIGRGHNVWPYAAIAAIRLSYRPVSMQSRRFRADIHNRSGERLVLLSTSWQTVALMVPQDESYRLFMLELHRRLAAADSKAVLSGGVRPMLHALSMAVICIVALAMIGLVLRALATESYAGALFLVAVAAVFGWQIGGFMRRNKPCTYTLDKMPQQLLP